MFHFILKNFTTNDSSQKTMNATKLRIKWQHDLFKPSLAKKCMYLVSQIYYFYKFYLVLYSLLWKYIKIIRSYQKSFHLMSKYWDYLLLMIDQYFLKIAMRQHWYNKLLKRLLCLYITLLNWVIVIICMSYPKQKIIEN